MTALGCTRFPLMNLRSGFISENGTKCHCTCEREEEEDDVCLKFEDTILAFVTFEAPFI